MSSCLASEPPPSVGLCHVAWVGLVRDLEVYILLVDVLGKAEGTNRKDCNLTPQLALRVVFREICFMYRVQTQDGLLLIITGHPDNVIVAEATFPIAAAATILAMPTRVIAHTRVFS